MVYSIKSSISKIKKGDEKSSPRSYTKLTLVLAIKLKGIMPMCVELDRQ